MWSIAGSRLIWEGGPTSACLHVTEEGFETDCASIFFTSGICGSNEKCRFWSKGSQMIYPPEKYLGTKIQKEHHLPNPFESCAWLVFWEVLRTLECAFFSSWPCRLEENLRLRSLPERETISLAACADKTGQRIQRYNENADGTFLVQFYFILATAECFASSFCRKMQLRPGFCWKMLISGNVW